MSIGLRIGSVVTEIGAPDLVHAFFSTISFHLEPDGWGTKYPELMRDLYSNGLTSDKAEKALKDVLEIREELRALPPDKVIWDIENLNAKPPWGNRISNEIRDLSNYFVTNSGRDVFDVLIELLQFLIKRGGTMVIQPTWQV